MQTAQNYARKFSSMQLNLQKLKPWDMWFCGSPDKYIHEFLIRNMNTQ